MKTIGKAVVSVVLLLVLVAVLICQLLASIPTWIWVLAVGYLVYRNRQLLRGAPRARHGGKGRRGGVRAGQGWASDQGVITAPPVVYVVNPAPAPAVDPAPAPVRTPRAIANAPEPWKFT